MTARYEFDTSEVDQLAASFAAAVEEMRPELERVTERGAYNIRRDARRSVRERSTGTYLPHYPRSITYEMVADSDAVEAEIGPEVDKPQGGMGPGVEFGSATRTRVTPPIPHLFPALEAEEPRYARQLVRLLEGVLR